MKIIIFVILTFFVFATGCTTGKKASEKKSGEDVSVNVKVSESDQLTGTIIKEVFTDKGGREHPEIYDLYLKTKKETIFIKFSDSKVTRAEIEKFLDKEVTLEVKITETGSWDSDDPEVQSRIGKYIAIKKILNQ
ncbi:MAG: hypothetical protein A2W91_09120 [Bacteroidetes bacterium GWF2_38_335]|nr:MAG: hypothetical protein A2W91_09120 [Bacteroidetes bacterium GWF2_38_335]OFY80532.1 MAG: hypothetical protein A2281_08845 [Bacteroidetes bacterium RIFOXYA12_FULL_38_20]HBS85857.1 hypothetical protein [Bacteroidales bacterium]